MLRCVSPYKSSLGAFAVGDVISDAALCAALLTDSPLSFTSDEPQVVAIEEPPVDKQIKRGLKK